MIRSGLAQKLRHYAEHNPKASCAVLVLGTAISFVAIVGFIELRGRFDPRMKKVGLSSSTAAPTSEMMTMNGAQLAAMLENAKNSSWRDNLRNAGDAQQRFMLPGLDVDDGNDAPEYVKKIDERCRAILRDERERLERERNDELDTSSGTRFWR
ncbi:hypothetical protein ACHAW5_010127 [Stephanodiscus triporus]|uniref:Transmembrane protein n=1 Tax=Stephanodiscus triporus TaxID=2934178 RepID=A0ABD3MV96_9STRA